MATLPALAPGDLVSYLYDRGLLGLRTLYGEVESVSELTVQILWASGLRTRVLRNRPADHWVRDVRGADQISEGREAIQASKFNRRKVQK
jgi:hypothetical protein